VSTPAEEMNNNKVVSAVGSAVVLVVAALIAVCAIYSRLNPASSHLFAAPTATEVNAETVPIRALRRRLHDYELAEEAIQSLNRTLEVDDLIKIKYSAQYFTEHLQNKRVVFIGDSISRYQYLSLVYSLSTGHFLNMSLMPNPVVEKSWASWHEFYAHTTEMLAPFEYCDCFRDTYRPWKQNENRYYFDNVHNISIVYLSTIDGEHCLGHWSDWGKLVDAAHLL
jgi:hypothetical protein